MPESFLSYYTVNYLLEKPQKYYPLSGPDNDFDRNGSQSGTTLVSEL